MPWLRVVDERGLPCQPGRVKAGALVSAVIGLLLATAGVAAGAVPGGLVFDTDRCDQGGQ
ncbi:MAG: hypothetical protein QOH38_472, partial [Thermoleophilaceae bacterium]|nr:hypothetical protein [Thermoleophilaceae bacterium]